MVAAKQVTEFTAPHAPAPWEVLYQSWADSLEHCLQQSEHLHASMGEYGPQQLSRLRHQLDLNLQAFQDWSVRWQQQHTAMLRWLARQPVNWDRT